MNSRLTPWLLAALMAGSAAYAQQTNQKITGGKDPVMAALSQGVDHIDSAPTSGVALQRRDDRYHLVNGDVMDLQFEFTPDFNQTVTIEPDGYVTLKQIGDMHVEGMTVPELKAALEKAYLKILANPVVTVDLKDFNKPYFLALGEFARPGKYDLRGETTVSAAIAMAGGYTTSAKHSQILLFRRVNDQWSSVTKLDLKKMLKTRDLSEDAYLHPGDMIYIPQNTLSKIKQFIPTPSASAAMYQPVP